MAMNDMNNLLRAIQNEVSQNIQQLALNIESLEQQHDRNNPLMAEKMKQLWNGFMQAQHLARQKLYEAQQHASFDAGLTSPITVAVQDIKRCLTAIQTEVEEFRVTLESERGRQQQQQQALLAAQQRQRVEAETAAQQQQQLAQAQHAEMQRQQAAAEAAAVAAPAAYAAGAVPTDEQAPGDGAAPLRRQDQAQAIDSQNLLREAYQSRKNDPMTQEMLQNLVHLTKLPGPYIQQFWNNEGRTDGVVAEKKNPLKRKKKKVDPACVIDPEHLENKLRIETKRKRVARNLMERAQMYHDYRVTLKDAAESLRSSLVGEDMYQLAGLDAILQMSEAKIEVLAAAQATIDYDASEKRKVAKDLKEERLQEEEEERLQESQQQEMDIELEADAAVAKVEAEARAKASDQVEDDVVAKDETVSEEAEEAADPAPVPTAAPTPDAAPPAVVSGTDDVPIPAVPSSIETPPTAAVAQ